MDRYDICCHFVVGIDRKFNRPISQISQCIGQISHNTPFCNRNVHTCAHFCYKMVICGIWDWCIVGFVRHPDCWDMIQNKTFSFPLLSTLSLDLYSVSYHNLDNSSYFIWKVETLKWIFLKASLYWIHITVTKISEYKCGCISKAHFHLDVF